MRAATKHPIRLGKQSTMPPKTTSQKPAAKRDTYPSITLRFDEPPLLHVYDVLEAYATKNERNPTAQARLILKQWAAKL